MTIRRILACTDLSAPAVHVIERGFQLAEQLEGSLTIVHALNPAPIDAIRSLSNDLPKNITQRIIAQTKEQLREFSHDPRGQVALEARVHLALGTPAEAIAAHVLKHRFDLVLVGARGSGFLHRLMPGGTAMRILRQTQSPVLVLKQPPRDQYRRLLIPIDASPHAALCVSFARSVAPDAEYVLLNAYDVPHAGRLRLVGISSEVLVQMREKARQESLRHMETLARDAQLPPGRYHLRAVPGDVVQEILALEQELACDLIVMGKQGDHTLKELLLGSVTKHILADSQADVALITLSKRTGGDTRANRA